MASQSPAKRRRSLTRSPTIDPDYAKEIGQRLIANVVPGSWYKDGTLLPKLAVSYLEGFAEVLGPGQRKCLHGKRTWGSLCSGSEGAHFIMQACEASLASWCTAFGQDALEMRQLFACESDTRKRRWIDAHINSQRRAEGSQLLCIFRDIKDMDGSKAFCETHQKECLVPDVDLLFVSTSCKDLSKLSNHKQTPKNLPVLAMQTSPGGSSDTFRGLLGFLDHHHVSVVLYENSDNMVDDSQQVSQSSLDVFQSELDARGFEGQNFLLNAKLFGVPQNRRRHFAVYVASGRNSIANFADRTVFDQFATLSELLKLCRRTPPPITDVLLPAIDLRVQNHLLACLETPYLDKASSKGGSWISEHQKEYGRLRLRWGSQPLSEATRTSPWLRTLTWPQKSILTLHQHRLIASSTQLISSTSTDMVQAPAPSNRAPPRLMIDLMPSIGRYPTTSVIDESRELAPCILPKQLLWMHLDEPRPMLGIEAMMLQGFPISKVTMQPWMANSLLQCLAGNAVACPVMLALAMSTIVAITWHGNNMPQTHRNSSEEDVQSALDLLAMICE